jgi:hypothetical protein
MEQDGSLSCSQEPATGPYFELHASSTHPLKIHAEHCLPIYT